MKEIYLIKLTDSEIIDIFKHMFTVRKDRLGEYLDQFKKVNKDIYRKQEEANLTNKGV